MREDIESPLSLACSHRRRRDGSAPIQIHRTLQLALIRRITLLNTRRKSCESRGLSLSEWIVAETRRPSIAKSTLSSAWEEGSLCHQRSNSAFPITLLSSAISFCIAGIPDIQLLNPPQMMTSRERDVRSPHRTARIATIHSHEADLRVQV